MLLSKWPFYRGAPRAQAAVADAFKALALASPAGTPERQKAEAAAAAAYEKLSVYLGDTPWTRANRADAEALEEAKRIAAKLRP